MPRILFIGDIVGRPGRTLVIESVKALKEHYGLTFIIANAENAAGGSGLTAAIAKDLYSAGVHAITLGDHVWDQRQFEHEIDNLHYVCRPANLHKKCPGRTHLILEESGFRLGIATLLGRQFMNTLRADCPFACADFLIEQFQGVTDGILLEIHAEATSEKVALGWYLDGKISALLGTHTHIPTADACILPNGTAYQTDVGMSGPHKSVLGREIQPIIDRFKLGMPQAFPVAKENVIIKGTLVDISPQTGKATHIQPIIYPSHGIIS